MCGRKKEHFESETWRRHSETFVQKKHTFADDCCVCANTIFRRDALVILIAWALWIQIKLFQMSLCSIFGYHYSIDQQFLWIKYGTKAACPL